MSSTQSIDTGERNDFICGVVEGFYGKPWTCLQRRDLFKKLRELKLNAFMYGPKDDAKHRARWRQLYDDIEVRELKTLIDEAAANGIDFYYSLSPGLDMVYSSQQETSTLCKKFDQLRKLGCKSFAILFDDIEPNVTNEEDKSVFNGDYAAAQVLVTNLVHDYLGKPNFLFCPTEYCESRAVPNVLESNYLNTIGSGLHPSIDIMWSGSRVISRFITEESIKTLSSVIKRPPVIWENLHANDYDKKRVYLGPYSGRSTKIIPQLRGVLTNPNCEYEANHVAIHTLAQWSRCTEDTNLHNRCNQDGHPVETNESIYDPNRALVRALRDWLPYVLSNRSLPQGDELLPQHRNDGPASNQLLKENDVEDVNIESLDVSAPSCEAANKIDMDTSSPPLSTCATIDSNSCDSCEMEDAVGKESTDSSVSKDKGLAYSACNPAIIPRAHHQSTLAQQYDSIDLDGLALIVDFFYLPFEHGFQGCNFLANIGWLINNSDVILPQQHTPKSNENEASMADDSSGTNQDSKARLIDHDCTKEVWFERAESLSSLCNQVNTTVESLIRGCPNKLLITELYPYLVDLRDMIIMIIDFIQYLRNRKSDLDHFHNISTRSARVKGAASYDEQEPWVHRGGLIGDIHRMINPA